ncbi:hypothetical protein BG004_006364 [Podila humilis]|nr:hypothetical protein BG004_006364 [Podila humilis]
MKEEHSRIKAENEAAAHLAAEMAAMNLVLEEAKRREKARSSLPPPSKELHKKSSTLGLGGRVQEDGMQATPLQTQPPPMPAQQPQNHPNHTLSQLARQTQFQSIPLSPIDGPTSNASREFPVPTIPGLRFPISPQGQDMSQKDSSGGHFYQTPALPTQGRYGPPPIIAPDHQSSSFYHRPASPAASRPSANVTNSSTTTSTSGSVMSNYSYSTSAGVGAPTGLSGPGVTAVYLSQPTFTSRTPKSNNNTTNEPMDNSESQDPSFTEKNGRQHHPGSPTTHPRTNQRYNPQSQLLQGNEYSMAAALPQQAISADHSLSRQKHIPGQQLHTPFPAPVSVAPIVIGTPIPPPRRVTTPTPQALNIAAAAAAAAAAATLANMSPKEKVAYQMELIDREFATFDYTVYESYHGLVDPVTMSVGDPPEWVRSRDQQ